jgi:hypothetical protein
LDGAVVFSMFKGPKISHLFDKSLSPGGGKGDHVISLLFSKSDLA